MVDDDLFISKTYGHWIFGADNTGNVMKKENIADLKKRVMTQVSCHSVAKLFRAHFAAVWTVCPSLPFICATVTME